MKPELCKRLQECRLTVIADDFRKAVERHKRPEHYPKPRVPAWIMRVIEEDVMVAESNVGTILRFPVALLVMARKLGVGPPHYLWTPPHKKAVYRYYLLDEVIAWLTAWGIYFSPGVGTMYGYQEMYYGAAIGTRQFRGGPGKIFRRGDLPQGKL